MLDYNSDKHYESYSNFNKAYSITLYKTKRGLPR